MTTEALDCSADNTSASPCNLDACANRFPIQTFAAPQVDTGFLIISMGWADEWGLVMHSSRHDRGPSFSGWYHDIGRNHHR